MEITNASLLSINASLEERLQKQNENQTCPCGVITSHFLSKEFHAEEFYNKNIKEIKNQENNNSKLLDRLSRMCLQVQDMMSEARICLASTSPTESWIDIASKSPKTIQKTFFVYS